MADIDLRHAHSLNREEARAATQKIAEELEQKMNASHHWDGDVLRFDRSGAQGHITVAQDEVHVVMKLGWMLKPLRGQIRQEAERLLGEFL